MMLMNITSMFCECISKFRHLRMSPVCYSVHYMLFVTSQYKCHPAEVYLLYNIIDV